jgi:Tfp pilus assembly protein PilE
VRVGSRSGFTIVEALLAAVVLSVGILALVGSAALTTRMLGRGRHSTRTGQVAAARIERLRQIAFSTVPACTGAEWRSDSAGGSGLSESWQILDPAGPARQVRIVLRSRHPTGISSDTVVTGMLCGSP